MVNEVVDPHQVTLVVTVWYLMSFSKAMMAHSHLMKRSNFRGEPHIAYCGKEYPAQDSAGSEKVSSTIDGTRCECGCWKYKGMR